VVRREVQGQARLIGEGGSGQGVVEQLVERVFVLMTSCFQPIWRWKRCGRGGPVTSSW
jgi:hypothetical protein